MHPNFSGSGNNRLAAAEGAIWENLQNTHISPPFSPNKNNGEILKKRFSEDVLGYGHTCFSGSNINHLVAALGENMPLFAAPVTCHCINEGSPTTKTNQSDQKLFL